MWLKRIAWLVWARSGRALLGPARLELGSTRPDLARLDLARLGLARLWLSSGWPGLAWPGSDQLGLTSLGSRLARPGPAQLSSAGNPPRRFSRYRNTSAAESQVTVKKLLRPARLDPSRLGFAWLGWDIARLSPAPPGSAWPDSGLDASAWQVGGSDGLGLARLVTALHVSADAWSSP